MPGTLERPIRGPKKRLIITCDGTWLDADNGLLNGQKQPPSNVSRIGWAIKDTSRDGIPQVVKYQAGVGTHGGRVSRVIGGATGAGLKENVREAYTYVANNYRDGDEIFLMGFSRGAFTARSVGAMIGDLGLLTRAALPYFGEIFEDYQHRSDERYISQYADIPFRDKGAFDKHYVTELERMGMTRTRIPIKAICCWDTVGSLGIPRTPWLDMFIGKPARKLKEYQFDDTKIHPMVENAFQALALDEHRAPFSPAIWEKGSNDQRTNLKQVWFPGVHSNIGGGYNDQELSNLTLAWMMSRLEPFLDFRADFLISQHQICKQWYKESEQRARWWSFGEIYRSFRGVYTMTGRATRTPGNYYRVDPYSGRQTSKRLKNTNEYIHASVRSRVGLKGPGTEERGFYNPAALQDWTFEAEPTVPGAAAAGHGGNLSNGGMIVWSYRGDVDRVGQDRIPEAVLLDTELALLRQFEQVDQYVKYMRPPAGGREKRRSRRNDPAMASGAMNGDASAYVDEKRKSSSGRRRGGSMGPDPRFDRNDDDGRRRRKRDSARY